MVEFIISVKTVLFSLAFEVGLAAAFADLSAGRQERTT
jgi:hypothetical protein